MNFLSIVIIYTKFKSPFDVIHLSELSISEIINNLIVIIYSHKALDAFVRTQGMHVSWVWPLIGYGLACFVCDVIEAFKRFSSPHPSNEIQFRFWPNGDWSEEGEISAMPDATIFLLSQQSGWNVWFSGVNE